MTETVKIQESEVDRFAADEEGSLESLGVQIVTSEFAGVDDGASRTSLREHRLTEFLLYGQGGSAFSDNPSVALSGENRGWSNSSMRGAFTNLYHRQKLLDYLWWLYQVADPVARNIVNTYTYFVVGEGARVTFSSGNKSRDKERTTKWVKMSKHLRWNTRVRQAVKGVALFGESFMLTLPRHDPLRVVNGDSLEGGNRRGAARRSGEPKLRVLNAGDIERIIHVPGDPDTVLAYAQRRADGQLVGNSPRDMRHLTFDTLPNSLHGHPILLPVLQHLYYYRSWLTNRHWLNMVRSRVPLIMRRTAGGVQQTRKVAQQYGRLPPPGTVWVLPGTIEADFPNLNVGAADAKDDGKQILRTIAMGVQLPEFLVTADASNANYSSSVVAESPAMRMFTDIQNVLEPQLEEVVAELVGCAPEDVAVDFPRVERNIKARADAFHLGYTDGVLSAQTYVTLAYNLPWLGEDGELARLEAEGVHFDELGRPEPVPTGAPDDPASTGGPSEPGTGKNVPPGSNG